MKTSKEKYCEHELVSVQECTKCNKTFDVLPSAEEIKDNCPHCGAEYFDAMQWECGTTPIIYDETLRSPLCKEREARQKAEAEVKRLKELVNESTPQNPRPYNLLIN